MRDGAGPSGENRGRPWRMVEFARLCGAVKIAQPPHAVMRCQQNGNPAVSDCRGFGQAMTERTAVIMRPTFTAQIPTKPAMGRLGRGKRQICPVRRQHSSRRHAGHGDKNRHEAGKESGCGPDFHGD